MGKNKKAIWMFKDEAGRKIIQSFLGLRVKLYAYRMLDGGGREKVQRNKKACDISLSFEGYKRCLFSRCEQIRKMNIIQSGKHTLYMEELNKVAMSANDDKRVIRLDGIHT